MSPFRVGAGADVDRQDENGNTPLHLAAMANKVAASEVLIELGASKELKNRFA